MNGIGWAVKQLQDGARVRRAGWNGKGPWLALVQRIPGEHIDPLAEAVAQYVGADLRTSLLPFVVMYTATGELVPWLCSQTDLLATDWEVAPAAEGHSPLWENARTSAGQEAKMAAQTDVNAALDAANARHAQRQPVPRGPDGCVSFCGSSMAPATERYSSLLENAERRRLEGGGVEATGTPKLPRPDAPDSTLPTSTNLAPEEPLVAHDGDARDTGWGGEDDGW